MPSRLQNGQHSYKTTNYNGTVTFSCNAGYLLRGNSSRSCQSTGRWSGTQPSCEIGECKICLHCAFCQHYYSNSSLLLLHVLQNYIMIQYIMYLPALSVSCDTPRMLSNGQGNYSSTTFGSRVTYTCNTGYRMTAGSSSRTCQSNGQWSGSHPTCSREYTLLYFTIMSSIVYTIRND